MNIHQDRVLINENLSYSDNHESSIQWNITLGTYGSCNSIYQTTNDEYILTGLNSQDIFLIRLDSNGNVIWHKGFGGKRLDWGTCVQRTTDNGCIITGFTNSYGSGEEDVWLIKTNDTGQEQWNKTFGGTQFDLGWSCAQTRDGGYIIGGSTKSFVMEKNDYLAIKTDDQGNEEWNCTYGGIGWDLGKSIIQTTDDGFIFTGLTDVSPDGSHQVDVGVIKIDQDGDQVWHKSYGDPIMQDAGLSVIQALDGGYVIVGHTGSFQDSKVGGDIWLIKTDSTGKMAWNRTFGGFGSDVGFSVWQTKDEGYVILGETDSFGFGQYDLIVLKTDRNGNEQWDMILGGSKDETVYGEGCRSIQQTHDGGYIIGGSTESFGGASFGPKPWVIKLSEPTIEVTIVGGNGVSVVFKNLKDEEQTNLTWTVDITGGFCYRRHIDGVIDSLPGAGETVINARLLGIGKVCIRVAGNGIGRIVNGFLLGAVLFLMNEE